MVNKRHSARNTWNAMSRNEGSLIALDGERIRRVLNQVQDDDVQTEEPD
jgi:hypothetical protein